MKKVPGQLRFGVERDVALLLDGVTLHTFLAVNL